MHGTSAADHQLQLAQAVCLQYITFAEAIKDIVFSSASCIDISRPGGYTYKVFFF